MALYEDIKTSNSGVHCGMTGTYTVRLLAYTNDHYLGWHSIYPKYMLLAGVLYRLVEGLTMMLDFILCFSENQITLHHNNRPPSLWI